jgi:hypothetical protein
MIGDPALRQDTPDNDNDEVRIRKKVRISPKPLKVLREQKGVVCLGKRIIIYLVNTKEIFLAFSFLLTGSL